MFFTKKKKVQYAPENNLNKKKKTQFLLYHTHRKNENVIQQKAFSDIYCSFYQ